MQKAGNKDRVFIILSWIIILFGIVIRVAVYLQNRDLFIDEANLARNIYERGFVQLAHPLVYEQYAPPVFLWIVKCCALLFGYGEFALRLYPLLAGIAALFVFMRVLQQYASPQALWYPLAQLAFGFIFIHYSSELKQYMCDLLIALLLIWLCLKVDVQAGAKKFIPVWFLAGSVAIWASMPSVFVLAGVGAYYIIQCLQRKTYRQLWNVVLVGALWLVQFLLYYLIILKPQANTDYLQNFHQGYFLFLVPDGKAQLMHNWYVFKEDLEEASGFAKITWIFNVCMLAIGLLASLRKNFAKTILIALPVACTLLAAAVHQYSLIPRVAMFMMPLLLILVGYGLNTIIRLQFLPVQLGIGLLAAYCLYTFASICTLWRPWQFEQITDEFKFLELHHITGQQLYVAHGAMPAFIYYTQIHPEKERWRTLSSGHILHWYTNYDSLAQRLTGRSAFIYTALGRSELEDRKRDVAKYLTLTDSLEIDDGRKYAYIYEKK